MKALILSLVVVLFSTPLYAQDDARLAREVHKDIQQTFNTLRTQTRFACLVETKGLEFSEHKETIADSIRRLDGWIYVELISRKDRAVAEADSRNFDAARALTAEIEALEPEAAEQAAVCAHRIRQLHADP